MKARKNSKDRAAEEQAKRLEQEVDKGREALEKSDFERAETIFRSIEKESPVLSALWLSRVYEKTGREEEALTLLGNLKDIKDERTKGVIFIAQINLYLQMNQPEKMIQLLEERFPGKTRTIPNSLLAICHLQGDQDEEAESCALKAIQAGEPNAHQLLGDIYFAMQKWQGSYEQYMIAYSEDRSMAYKVASALLALDRNSEAIPFLQESLRQGEYNAAGRLASAYLLTKQYRKAIAVADTAVKCGYDDVEYVEGLAYKALGDDETARLHFQNCISNHFYPEGVFISLAQCLLNLDRREEAAKVLFDAVKKGENGVWLMQGIVYERRGMPAQAVRCLRKSMEVEPDKALMASYELGMIYYGRHEFKKAAQFFQDAWSGGYIPGGIALGDCSYFQDKFKQASVWYQKVLDTGYVPAMYPLAHAYRQMKQYDKARDLLLQCLEKGDKRAHLGLALVAEATGEIDEAEEQFEISIEKKLEGANGLYGRFLLERGDFFSAVTYLEKAWEDDKCMEALPYLVRAYFKAEKPLHDIEQVNKYLQLCDEHGIPLKNLLANEVDDAEVCKKNVDDSSLKYYRSLHQYDN